MILLSSNEEEENEMNVQCTLSDLLIKCITVCWFSYHYFLLKIKYLVVIKTKWCILVSFWECYPHFCVGSYFFTPYNMVSHYTRFYRNCKCWAFTVAYLQCTFVSVLFTSFYLSNKTLSWPTQVCSIVFDCFFHILITVLNRTNL